jgi:hypothetical protein
VWSDALLRVFNMHSYVRLGILGAVTVESTAVQSSRNSQAFGGTYCLHLQGLIYAKQARTKGKLQAVSKQIRTRREQLNGTNLAACFLLVSCLAYLPYWRWRQEVPPKVGDSIPDYTVSYLWRDHYSYVHTFLWVLDIWAVIGKSLGQGWRTYDTRAT